MALLLKSENLVVVCIHRHIIVYDNEKQSYTKTDLPAFVKRDAKIEETKDEDDHDNENNNNQNKSKDGQVSGHVAHARLSKCGNLLAVTTSGDKMLFVLKLNKEKNSFEVSLKYELVRGSSALRFSPDSKLILLADKTGDCFKFHSSGVDKKEKGQWILGHFSMVLDILMTSDQKFIITSDRDEKIRITNYPKTEIIETYCLGHLEFVSSINTLDLDSESLLVSLSGDKSLRLWDYIRGEELLRKDLPSPGISMAINELNHIAIVLLGNPVKIQLYKFVRNGSLKDFHLIAEHSLNDRIKRVTSTILDKEDNIFLAGLNENDEVELRKLTVQLEEGNISRYTECSMDELMDILRTDSTSLQFNEIDDLSILFKKKFDNIKEYHEKKKRRIEQKTAK